MIINGKKITTIVSDLDGTLLPRGDVALNPTLFDMIWQMKKKGVAFIAASGRQYYNMQKLFSPVVDEISYICENGSLIAKNGIVLEQKIMEHEKVIELLLDMKAYSGTNQLVSSAEVGFIDETEQEFGDHIRNVVGNRVEVLTSFEELTAPAIKASVFWKGGIPKAAEDAMHEKYDAFFSVVDGGNGWLDFTAKGANKGNALRFLSEKEHFLLEETICIGDSENDMSMLEIAGESYAMHTAREHVKQAADFVCKDALQLFEKILSV